MKESFKFIIQLVWFLVVMHVFWFGFLFFLFGLSKDGDIFETLGGLLAILSVIRYAQYVIKKA